MGKSNTENMAMCGIWRRGGVFLVVMLITVLSACAATPEESAFEPVPPASLGRIGVVSVRSDFPITGPFPYTSAGEGAAKGGVAMGAAGAVYPCVHALAFLPAYPICVATFAVVGVAGGAVNGEIAAQFESGAQTLPTSMELQDRLRSQVLPQARTLAHTEIMDLGPEGVEYRPPPDPGQPIPEETQKSRDDSAAVDEYRRFAQKDADTVLETAIGRYAAWASGNNRFGLRLEARSRLVRTRDGAVIALARHDFASPSYTLAQWTENQAARLRAEIRKGIDSLAEDIARCHFSTSTS